MALYFPSMFMVLLIFLPSHIMDFMSSSNHALVSALLSRAIMDNAQNNGDNVQVLNVVKASEHEAPGVSLSIFNFGTKATQN